MRRQMDTAMEQAVLEETDQQVVGAPSPGSPPPPPLPTAADLASIAAEYAPPNSPPPPRARLDAQEVATVAIATVHDIPAEFSGAKASDADKEDLFGDNVNVAEPEHVDAASLSKKMKKKGQKKDKKKKPDKAQKNGAESDDTSSSWG